MRRIILAVLAASLTAAALPVVADAQSGKKPPAYPIPGPAPGNPAPAGASLTIVAKPNPTVFQGATVISGRLKGLQNNANRTVTLREDSFPFFSIDKLVNAQTDANGDYVFTRRPAKNSAYKVVLFGTTLSSPGVLVNVRTRVSQFVSDRTPRVGQIIRISGRACPTHNGLPVGIQRKSKTGFGTVRSTRLRSSTRCSTYSRRFRVYVDGVFRVVTKGHGDHARGISRTVFIDVHR